MRGLRVLIAIGLLAFPSATGLSVPCAGAAPLLLCPIWVERAPAADPGWGGVFATTATPDGGTWLAAGATTSPAGRTPFLAAYGTDGDERWRLLRPAAPSAAMLIVEAARAGDKVHAGAFDGAAGTTTVLSVDAATGDVDWATTLPARPPRLIPIKVVSDETRVFVAAMMQDASTHSLDAHLFALDRSTGDLLWSAAFDGAGRDAPLALALHGDKVVLGGFFDDVGRAIALRAHDGTVLWNTLVAPHPPAGVTALGVHGDRILAAGWDSPEDSDMTAWSLDAATGAIGWSRTRDGAFGLGDGALHLSVTADGRVVIAGMEGDGVVNWEPPIYVVAGRTVLWGLDASTGMDAWVARDPYGPDRSAYPVGLELAPSGRVAYVASGMDPLLLNAFLCDEECDGAVTSDARLVAVDTLTGAILSQATYDGEGGTIDLAWSLTLSPSGDRALLGLTELRDEVGGATLAAYDLPWV